MNGEFCFFGDNKGMSGKERRMLSTKRMFWLGVGFKLDNLREYASILEDSLTEQLGKFTSNVEERASQLSEEQQEDFYEFHQDDYWRLSEVFPNTLRSSLFVTCCSLLEHELTCLCRYFDKRGNYPIKFDDSALRGAILDKAKTYLKKIGVAFPSGGVLWQNIRQYNELRNLIVHQGGQLNILGSAQRLGNESEFSESERRKLKRQKRVASFIQSNPSISLDGMNRIQLSKEFCLEVIHALDKFFKELYEALPYTLFR